MNQLGFILRIALGISLVLSGGSYLVGAFVATGQADAWGAGGFDFRGATGSLFLAASGALLVAGKLRLGFGVLFIGSGLVKLVDPISFADDVRNFRLVGDPVAAGVALFLPWLEVFAGIGVMLDRWVRGGSFLLVASIVVFTGAIAIAWARGLDITCGCFGSNEELNYPVKIAQNLGLLAWGIVIWWREEMRAPLPPRADPAQSAA